MVAEIATASREQTQGIDQVSRAVSEMDQVTQGNAAAAEETASSATELNEQSQVMLGAVAELGRLAGIDTSQDDVEDFHVEPVAARKSAARPPAPSGRRPAAASGASHSAEIGAADDGAEFFAPVSGGK